MPLHKIVDSGLELPPPDIQRTTFAVDSLARMACNLWEEAVAAQRGGAFDVVIVGAGMYGGYLAAKLFELGRRMADESQAPRVLVLEWGPFLLTEHVQNVTRRSTDLASAVAQDLVDPGQTNEPTFVKHSRCVGGKSLFWGGWAPRLTPADLARLDAEGDRLWPDEVATYLLQTGGAGGYALAEREIGAFPVQDFINGSLYGALKSLAEAVVAAGTVPSLDAVVPPPLAAQGESPGSGLFSFDKFSSVPALFDAIREDAELHPGDDAGRRLFLVPNAEVLRLETSGGRVRQVVVALADPADPRDRTKARVVRLDVQPGAIVVLAGNTVNSTRLALNSFPRPAALAPDSALMGRNLMVHARSNFVWRVKRSALALPPPDPLRTTTAALHVTGKTTTGGGAPGGGLPTLCQRSATGHAVTGEAAPAGTRRGRFGS